MILQLGFCGLGASDPIFLARRLKRGNKKGEKEGRRKKKYWLKPLVFFLRALMKITERHGYIFNFSPLFFKKVFIITAL